jgi:hypothetical protein
MRKCRDRRSIGKGIEDKTLARRLLVMREKNH